MMRKFTVCLVLCATGLFVSSCNDDVSSPPKSTLAVDKNDGVVTNDANTTTEFTFTVDEVSGASTISLLPYGTANQTWGGIPISAASFSSGKATIKFKYAQVGSFDAIVVTNNHSADGNSKNSYSNTVHIEIKSPDSKITEFSFAKITHKNGDTEVVDQLASTSIANVDNGGVDQTAHTIKLKMPYGSSLTDLIATFTSDHFTKVTVGGTTQTSGTSKVTFTSPVVYTVTASDGSTTNYTVTVTNEPINTDATFKSFSGKETSTKATATLGTAWASNGDLILYDVKGTPRTSFDSVNFSYTLNNPFALLRKGSVMKPVAQDTRFDLSAVSGINITGLAFKVIPQDSVVHAVNVFAVDAPELIFTTTDPTADIVDVNTGFVALVKALKGTVLDSKIKLDFKVNEPDNVTILSITLKDASSPGGITVPNNSTQEVNFSDAVSITINVKDDRIGGLTYDVVYTAGLTELK